MKRIRTLALSLGLLAMIGSAGTIPAAAATVSAAARHAHAAAVRTQPAPQLPLGAHYGPDGVIYSGMGSPIPGYVLSTPDKCWEEGSYGQWSSCDGD